MKKKKIIISKPARINTNNSDVNLTDIDNISKLPDVWNRGFSLSENDTLDDCFYMYEKFYKHPPKEGWVYTDPQQQKILYLKLEEGDK